MNKLTTEKRVQILKALTEGCSLRSTSRMFSVSINTVTKLLVEAGQVCAEFQYEHVRRLNCKRLELDEMWGFVYSKAKNTTPEIAAKVEGAGSIWTWVAIDSESKLIVSYLIGDRDGDHVLMFVNDVADRLNNRVQITTDGLKAYLQAMDVTFGDKVDYAVLHKIYGPTSDAGRYSPAECIGCETQVVTGTPDTDKISTSFVERQNLTVRMRMRRHTRLTNAFSKKIENLECATALHYFVYNFITRHTTLRMTPAMKAGLCKHMWTFEELVELIDRTIADKKRNGLKFVSFGEVGADNNSN